MIFTSPSSARGNLDEEPVTETRRRRKKTPSKRPPVAVQLGMDGQVTARAIAYAAVQVRYPLHCSSWLTYLPKLHFALCDATHWMSTYNGFNYEEFYEFIVDFFEADKSPEGIAASRELYSWWNKYVSDYILTSNVTNASPEKCSRGPLLLERPRLPQRGSRRSRFCKHNAEPAFPACRPSFSQNSVFACSVNTNIIIRKIPSYNA